MTLPRLARFLLSGPRRMLAALVLSGLLAGFTSVGLLAIINRLLHHGAAASLALAFFGLALLKVGANAASQILLVYFSQDAILSLGLTLCRQVTATSLRTLERKGQAAVLTTLTDDTSALAWALQCVPNLIINFAVLAGCAAYLAWLSWPLLLAVSCLTAIGTLAYSALSRRAFRLIYAARDCRADLFRHFRSLTEGVKELMMHRGRREAFLGEEITGTALALRRLNLEATQQYVAAESWTQAAFYGLIGAVLLLFPRLLDLNAEALTGYVFAILYMMGPIWGVIGTLPTLARGQIALEKLDELGLSLDRADVAPVPSYPAAEPAPIEMRDIVFAYEDQGNGFVLGPLDFRLDPGSLVFVVGGNGSGKSTFVKLLSGLYRPHTGEIRLGGRIITDVERDWYRQHFAVVFSDFYLFERLLGAAADGLPARVAGYLAQLRLDTKVRLTGSRLSTTDLSQGQRRRLALLTAYLEDRPFYIFDEWAADQDPQYKQVFYTELLPELRARGKGIAVITHDDRYFHLGDRLIKLDNGQIVQTSSPPSQLLAMTSRA